MNNQRSAQLSIAKTNTFAPLRLCVRYLPFRASKVSIALLVLGYLFAIGGCGQPAQIGADPESFDSVDALWTAIRAKRTDLLEQTEKDLNTLHTQKKLPDDAHASLQKMIDTAKAGDWISSRDDLRKFMESQRRGR